MRQAGGPIRVAIVDDSPTIRRLVARELSRHPDLELIGEASHPYEARDMIKTLNPEVLILDVEMPHMNGLDFLHKIMTLRPMPVLMFSSITKTGMRDALEALSIGAVDCLEKTDHIATDGTLEVLAEKVRMVARARVKQSIGKSEANPESAFKNCGYVVLIGSSTGGVDALERVLERFPANCPPTLITQHMPADFLRSFAARMNNLTQPKVQIAEEGVAVKDGNVYVAPGGDFHLALAPGKTLRCALDPQDKVSGHRPSVDVLFRSAVPSAKRVVAAILTGMGSDGARGMCELRAAGARTIAQDEETSTVFGMPRVALELGGAERAVPLGKVADTLLEICSQPRLQTA